MIRGIFTCKLSTVFHTLAFMSHREKYVDIIKDGGNLVRVPIKIVVDNHENMKNIFHSPLVYDNNTPLLMNNNYFIPKDPK